MATFNKDSSGAQERMRQLPAIFEKKERRKKKLPFFEKGFQKSCVTLQSDSDGA